MPDSLKDKELPTCPIDSIITAMVTDPRDWSIDEVDAWLYGIIVGWGDDELAEYLGTNDLNALEEIQKKHNWSYETVERLKQLRAKFESITKNLEAG